MHIHIHIQHLLYKTVSTDTLDRCTARNKSTSIPLKRGVTIKITNKLWLDYI
jgi:hypothetical protein